MKSNTHDLFHGETGHAWHRRVSADFPALAGDGAFAVLPVYSFRRLRSDGPLDAEECLGGRILAEALQLRPPAPPFLVLPPLRHTPRLDPAQAFTLGLDSCSGLLEEIVRSVVRSGISRVIFLHLHPPLADWIDASARDLRVETGAAFYRIDLTVAGLDLGSDAVDVAAVCNRHATTIGHGHQQEAAGKMPEPRGAGVSPAVLSLLSQVATRLDSLFDQIVRHDAARKGVRP